jgi:hypothetical protein
MQLFEVIDDGVAILRAAKGVHKQTKVYRRGERVFVPHGGGFVRVVAEFNGAYGTSHPDIKVLEIEAEGVDTSTGEPRFRAALKAVA